MNSEKALELMEQGKTVQSEVSKTYYRLDMTGKGILYANDQIVSVDYVTDEEWSGEWSLIERFAETLDEVSDETIQQCLKDACVNYEYNEKHNR